jgi:two-component system response regulator HydG
MATILHVDDEPSVGLLLEDTLGGAGHRPIGAANVVEALQVLSREHVDLIISDYRIPGLTGLEFLSLLQREGYDVPLIMLTGYESIEHAVAALKAGAIQYITKPVKPQQLELAVERALEFVRLLRENETLRREVMEFRNERQIIGDSVVIRRILQTVAMAAPTRATVLVEGESGTGKQLFARAIHDQSDRRAKPFVKLNCAALPDGLIESALFGHERGAFTGAVKRVEGALEQANGGTLLLDEISEMKPELQAKLLRVLQAQEFERVGGASAVRVDVRMIATTNRDLAAQAAAGTFRQDLYDRLSDVPIFVPPLRERVDEIPLLAYRFATRTAAEIRKEITGISQEALALLGAYPWPGNIRELQHAVERAVILSREPILQPHAFEGQQPGLLHPLARQAAARTASIAGSVSPSGATSSAGSSIPANAVVLTSLDIDEAEAALIQRALEVAKGNRTRTAELLGISVRTLRNKLNGPRRIEVA